MKRRRLRVERLEEKRLLAGDFSQNDTHPLDVNDDQTISARDALMVINSLSEENPRGFTDVNGNGEVTALDALLVINGLNRGDKFEQTSLSKDGVLTIRGSNKDDFIQVNQVRGSRTVEVTVNDTVATFKGVKSLDIRAANGNDEVFLNTFDDPDFLISSVVRGGNGDDIIQGGGGDDALFGENGDDIVSNFVTDENYAPVGRGSTDILDGGNGNDSLWGGWGIQDTIRGGNGNDTIYDIVGGVNDIDGGNGDDYIIARTGAGLPTNPLNDPGALVADAVVQSDRDSRVVLFDAGSQANGPVVIGNTLYALNLGGGAIEVNRDGNYIVVNYNDNEFAFVAKGITAIAGLGGPSDDTFVNNTDISSVFYGLGGNDVLIGGRGDDVLKGGDGDDFIDGRGGLDDTTGDAGTDVLQAADGSLDIVRIDSLDSVYADLGVDRLVIKRNLAFS